jgi:hypothetical protein
MQAKLLAVKEDLWACGGLCISKFPDKGSAGWSVAEMSGSP